MGLDRDDLAARNMVAAIRTLDAEVRVPPTLADFAVECADALIARLRPVAPVADAAPRPEWVRITSLPLGDDGRYPFAVGQVFKVSEWEDSAPRVIGPRREGITLSASGASIDPRHPGFATWEPCAAPAPSAAPPAAPSPAASPAAYVPTPAKSGAAAYVPQVGDVVRFKDCDNFAEILVVRVDDPKFYGKIITQDGFYRDEAERDSAEYRYIRPATASERAAAGLPPITPDHPQGGQGAAGDQRVAAGLDAPAFDESSERETAVDIAKDRGLDVAEEVGFVAGWLARARIAANGGVA